MQLWYSSFIAFAFYRWCLYLGFKSQGLFSAVIQKLIEKSHWLLVKETRVMLTSGLAHKNMSSLQHSIYSD